MPETDPKQRAQAAKKPGPRKTQPKGATAPKKRMAVSRLGYYIIIFGWLTIAINFLLAFEWASPDRVLERVMAADLQAFAFRAVAMILPLIFSILGYMVYQREKVLWRVIATGKKLEHMNISLQSNYEKLSGQMSDKDRTGLTDQAVDVIKGIHRQSKTSINIIAALMEARSKKLQDELGADSLREFQRRFRAVEHMHESMSRCEDCTTVNMADYLKLLSNDLVNTYGGKINLRMDVKPLPMGIDRALSCGLIVSELVSNSLRFAFDEEAEKPELRVSLDKDDEGLARLRVMDNGAGMPEGLDVEMLDTLGLKIIGKLARQLKGTAETQVMGGTTVDIRFPLK
ncbi:MAG TPA: hypothetical protein ENI12_06930 [Nitrospirae bacterium]|nr:hypothetical protein [Nitrospirota bacterium]